MDINVTMHRSDPWLEQQRLATGENVPSEITVPISVGAFPPVTRRLLLGVHADYRDIRHLGFNQEYEVMCLDSQGYCTYGRTLLYCDEETPTAAGIEAAILAAFGVVAAKRVAYAGRKRSRQQEEARKHAEKEAHDQGIAGAKVVLAKVLASLAQQRDDALADLAEVCDFLARVPQDALRGALKARVCDEEPHMIAALRAKIEDASPVRIFLDEDEDEDDDEEEDF